MFIWRLIMSQNAWTSLMCASYYQEVVIHLWDLGTIPFRTHT